MISITDISSDIQNIATSGSNNIEFRIETTQLLFWINEVRAMLIAQALNKKDDLNDTWLQTISCLEMEQVDSAECCTITSGCYVLRSKKQIPATVDTYKDNWIVSVTTPLGDTIPKQNRFKARYQKYNKFTADKPGWYLKDDYLYITNNQLLKYVNVTGLFSDPSELENFISCENEACFSLDGPYPVSLNQAKIITDIILQTRVYPFLSLVQDKKNDGDDNTITAGRTPNLVNNPLNNEQ